MIQKHTALGYKARRYLNSYGYHDGVQRCTSNKIMLLLMTTLHTVTVKKNTWSHSRTRAKSHSESPKASLNRACCRMMHHLLDSKAISESAAVLGPNCTSSSCLPFSRVEWIAWPQSMALTCLARRPRRGHAHCVHTTPFIVATTIWRRLSGDGADGDPLLLRGHKFSTALPSGISQPPVACLVVPGSL